MILHMSERIRRFTLAQVLRNCSGNGYRLSLHPSYQSVLSFPRRYSELFASHVCFSVSSVESLRRARHCYLNQVWGVACRWNFYSHRGWRTVEIANFCWEWDERPKCVVERSSWISTPSIVEGVDAARLSKRAHRNKQYRWRAQECCVSINFLPRFPRWESSSR
jgi:hypothetical protein